MNSNIKINGRENTDDDNIVSAIWHRHEYYTPGYEINSGDIVIDIGAHIGGFSLWAGAFGATVHAFEPEPSNFYLLKMNAEANDYDIHIHNKALTADGKPVKLYCDPVHPATHTIVTPRGAGNIPTIVVDSTTLEDAISIAGGHCNFLKMDCEWAEYIILMSAGDEVLSNVDKIAMEFHGDRHNQILHELSRRGFYLDRVVTDTYRNHEDNSFWVQGRVFASRIGA